MNKSDDLILLQDFVPYNKSIKWELHNSYFQKRGNKAWLNSEVPYHITSNSVAARQNALLIYHAAMEIEKGGILKGNDRIRVLEIASGLGLFAINFIHAFKEFEKKYKKGFLERLTYYFTDYSEQNLLDALNNPEIKKLRKEGLLTLGILEATQPQKIRLLGEKKFTKTPQLVSVIANYLHCCLPLTIVRKKGDNYYEKHVKLFLKRSDKNAGISTLEDALKKLIDITNNLTEEVKWVPTNKELFRKKTHLEVVENIFKDDDLATFLYPYGSFQSLESTMPLLLEGGVVLITDKGYVEISQMIGEHECKPSIHGNSLAYPVNFPFLDMFLKSKGFLVMRTLDPNLSVQTLIMVKRDKGKLNDLFNDTYIKNNINNEAYDYYRAGWQFSEKQKDYSTAIRFFNRAKSLNITDSTLYFYLGCSLYYNGNVNQSIVEFSEGKEHDYFNEYDFDFWLGFAWQKLGYHQKAVQFYLNSVKRQTAGYKLYNIALCYEKINNRTFAKNYYEKSLELNPDDVDTLKALLRVKSASQIV